MRTVGLPTTMLAAMAARAAAERDDKAAGKEPSQVKQREQQRPPKNAKLSPRAQRRNEGKAQRQITKRNYMRG